MKGQLPVENQVDREKAGGFSTGAGDFRPVEEMMAKQGNDEDKVGDGGVDNGILSPKAGLKWGKKSIEERGVAKLLKP
jgi:hypothetical protein